MTDSDYKRGITIDITASIDLDEDDVWPDGPPDDWTIDDAIAAVEASGSVSKLIRDWNLGDCFEIEVYTSEGDTARPWDRR